MLFSKLLVKKQLKEPRPLPMGMTEFHEWSDRIIAGAMVPATPESLKYTLSNMILHMKPTEDHAEDLYFIKALRKYAANQVADYYRQKIYPQRKAELAALEQNKADVTPPTSAGVLEDKKV